MITYCRTAFACFVLLLVSAIPAHADIAIYSDALAGGWQDWSWGGVTRNFANGSPVHAGSAAIAVTYTGSWSGLQLGRNDAVDISAYDTFRFWVHGGTAGGQTVEVQVGNNSSGASVSSSFTPTAATWTRIDLPLAGLGTTQINYIHWFNATPGTQPVFYLDDAAFIASGVPTPTPAPPGAGPALSVNAGASRHAISPYIYGMNFADESLAAELDLPVSRWGGNATTRYSWQNDTSNRASDWYFENIPNDNPNPGALPNGSSSDRFVEQNQRTGTDTLLTIPMIGWTPKARLQSCGFSVAKYGAQQSTDPWFADCGNGVRSNGSTITGNDPNDISTAITPAFVQSWMDHLIGRYGNASGGGVHFYNLDNEPELWDDTHRDVHPAPTSYDEMRDRTYQYAAAIKARDAGAKTLGPASWGWSAYFWSALDWSAGGAWWNNPQDRLAHGNVPFVDWYLQQMRDYEQQQGTRILDYLDLHYYPQASGVSLSGAGSASTQALRLRSTRSLWDPTYSDESWIGEAVRLIPRMRDWVTANYPGTKLAVSEYNWGALDHINGALAQADVLGIFGREGLDLATLWDPPTSTEPGAFAFRVYRNFDGNGGRFGDLGVDAASADQSQLSIYAAENSADGSLTIIVINKATQALTSSVSLAGYNPAGAAVVYRYSNANLTALVRQADQAVTAGGFTATFPASSITMFAISAAAGGPTPTITSTAALTATRTPTRTPTRTSSATPSNTAVAPPSATPVPPTATPVSTATATATTSIECGDGNLDVAEQCDDGNRDDGDGCDRGCRYELISGTSKGSRAATSAACVLEWSVVNPGNSPALDRWGRRSAVQACRNNDPSCDFDLDADDRTCQFRVVACVNNLDSSLPTCTARGVADAIRLVKPRSNRDPENANNLLQALQSWRDPATGEAGLQLPAPVDRTGWCSEPFTLSVPLTRSTRSPGKLRVRTQAYSLGEGAAVVRDRDSLTFECWP